MAKNSVAPERRAVIYKILNLITGDFYIGSTMSFRRRKAAHFRRLKTGHHINKHLQNAYNKYNAAFEMAVILECCVEHQFLYEQICIDGLAPRYNIAKKADAPPIMRGADHPMFGKNLPMETRQRMSASRVGKNNHMFGKKHSKESLRKMSLSQSGRTTSAETREKLSKALSGPNSYMYGKTPSAETRRKISEANTGRKLSAETLKKRSAAISGENHPMFGKQHSEEAKEKMRRARRAYLERQKELAG